MPIVSQKQMVESLEQVIDQRRADLGTKTKSNPLYRQCLKIHHMFLLHIAEMRAQMAGADADEALKLPVAVQVEILMQILSQQVVHRAQRYTLAQSNYRRCTV